MKILANIARDDMPYQGLLQQSLARQGISAKGTTKVMDIGELLATAHSNSVEAILVTNPKTLANLVTEPSPSLEDWRGSLLNMSVPIIISNPIDHINTKILGKVIHNIDIHKIKQTKYHSTFKYKYTICDTYAKLIEAQSIIEEAAIITVDIETNYHNQITSVSFTSILSDWSIGNTYVITLEPKYYPTGDENLYLAWDIVKEICESPNPKVFHNGTFDCYHLLRYHICVENYLWDTEFIWRCWHAELPKALAKIASFVLPDYYYWKHESESSPLEYNAKDTINTARVFIYMLKYAPEWVWVNYTQMVPNIGPVLYTQFEGILTDLNKLKEARASAQKDLDRDLDNLRTTIGIPSFNPGSPQQVSALLYGVLLARKPGRSKSSTATGEVELKAVARQHPIFSYIVNLILKYRENKKAISTYYDATLTKGNRLLYSLNIDGTETARMSCTASSLRTLKSGKSTYVKTNMVNYGTQIQNVPYYHKKALKADPGYSLLNVDKSQSEARCVGYISPAPSLIEAIENPPELLPGVRDFYCYTGYKFFGIKFDKSHPLRQAVKKIIHGTNYMMGVQTFIDAVGVEELQEYKKILRYRGTLFDFAKHLLTLYHATYPEVKTGWDEVYRTIQKTGRLTTPDGWTRIVEGDVTKHHSILRGMVAHRSQHWSVWGINRAMWKIFYEIQVPSKGDVRLKAQIHDSVLLQIRNEKLEPYTKEVLKVMDIPQPCPHGIMRIPLDTDTGEYWKS